MKTVKNVLEMVIAVCLLVMTACNHDDPEGQTGVKLTFKASTSGTMKSASTLSSDPAGIYAKSVEISDAHIGIEKIELEPFEHENADTPEKVVFTGPFAVNLLTGVAVPEINWTTVTPGLYEEIEFETAGVLEGGKSIMLNGIILLADNSEVPFEFSTSSEFEVEVEDDDGIMISEGVITDILVLFKLENLFKSINLAYAQADENGVLIFNDETNPNLTHLLKKRIKEITCFENDDDDDDDDD